MSLKIFKKIIIGKIFFPYGILGWLKIFSFTETKENIFKYKPLLYYDKKKIKKLKIQSWKNYKNFFLIKIKNINTRNEAFFFKNKKIFIYSNQLKKKYKNEYYWHEILNSKVFDKNKKFIGIVKEIIRTPSNDILKITLKSFKQKNIEKLIPFIENKIIKKIKIKEKKIIINQKKDKFFDKF
ncbi:ribosome maturation factor RimM [Buchnera aphidicola (Periphyllus koelreuteriae)]|uniref:ribosome maturation factor RimM n=1 Tax=Buchnera aphidicola TaxID=9 RepID=UPI0031B82921